MKNFVTISGLFFLLLLPWMGNRANAQLVNGMAAHDLLGQYTTTAGFTRNYTQSTVNNANGSTYALGFNGPREVVVDSVGHRLFAVDAGNHRVLVFNLDNNNQLVDKTPDFVLGQANFTGNTSGLSNTQFNSPRWLTYDAVGKRLFVSDITNNRVLVFDVTAISNGEAAVNVLGQPDFATNTSGTSAVKMFNPTGVEYDPVGNRLFVAEDNNVRVLIFNVAGITNGESAVNVLGQSLFTTNTQAIDTDKFNTPVDLAYDPVSKRLFVSDEIANRVLVFDLNSITNGENAVAVLGQANFTASGPATTQSGLSQPRGLSFNPCTKQLFVADRANARVMIFDVTSITNGENAINVLGKANFTSNTLFTTQSGISNSSDCYFEVTSGKLYVSDVPNNRVIIFGLDVKTGAAITNATCSTLGAINITPAGGATPYTYNWGGGVTTQDRTNLVGGTYTVIVTDNCGAQDTANFTVTGPTSATDTDGDLIYNECDLDDDNDGILDAIECPLFAQNGSFESPVIQGYSGPLVFNVGADGETDYVSGFASLSGWNVISGSVDLLLDYNNASAGLQSVDLYGTSHGVIEQQFSIPASGTAYNFSIDYSSQDVNSRATISIDGVVVTTLANAIPSVSNGNGVGITGLTVGWNSYNYAGVSTGTTVTIRFTSTVFGASGTGIFLDNFIFNSLCPDFDGDGISNSLDTDSDGDGCFDAIEGGGAILASQVNVSGRITGTVSASGIPTAAGAGQTVGSSTNASIVVCCDATASGYTDSDGDNVTDRCDIDDDNDGILDTDEGVSYSYSYSDMTTNASVSSVGGTLTNTSFTRNGAVAINSLTIDPLNTGLTAVDAFNASFLWDYGNGIGSTYTVYSFGNAATLTPGVGVTQGLDIAFKANELELSYNGVVFATLASSASLITISPSTTTITVNSSGVVTVNIPTVTFSPATATIPGNLWTSANKLNYAFMVSMLNLSGNYVLSNIQLAPQQYLLINTDLDGLSNYLDTDSDGDGCFDAIEGGGSIIASQLSSGRITGGVDANGLPLAMSGTGQSAGTSAIATRLVTTAPAVTTYASVPGPKTITVTATSDNATSYSAGAPVYGTPGNNNANRTYQWYLGDPDVSGVALTNTAPYSGVTTASLTISPTTAAMNGNQYYVKVGASNNECISTKLTTQLKSMAVSSQPASLQYACIGYSNKFSVTATAAENGDPLTYQWKKGANNIPGATNATYQITSVTNADTGAVNNNSYSCVVTEAARGITITTDTAKLILNKQAIYNGGSADWSTPGNWSTNAAPDSTVHAYVPASLSNYPNITTGTVKCKCLTIENGASVTVDGGTLEIAGRINDVGNESWGGTLNAVNGSVVMNGTSVPQTLWANVFQTNFIKDLKIDNAAGVSLQGPLSLTGVYTPVATSVLTSNGNLTLKSTAANTARVIEGPLAGGYITGDVTVERYLAAHPGRRWTSMAAPVTQLIQNAWQQDIYVTGPGTGGFMCAPPYSPSTQPTQHTNGMDASQLNPVSMFTYTNGSWAAITNTNATSLTPGLGYYVNVRGDRNVQGCGLLQYTTPQTGTTATYTATVKAKGPMTQGSFNVVASNPNFFLLGNPYASELSFNQFYSANSGKMEQKYWLFTPSNIDGNYTTWDGTNNAGAPAGYSDFDRIASGQAFFVNVTSPSTFNFTESQKVNARQAGGFKTTMVGDKIRINLYVATDSFKQDDALIVFDQTTSANNNTTTAIDSRSINVGAAWVATLKGTDKLAIHKRNGNYSNDTVGIYVYAGVAGGYSFQFTELGTMTNTTVYLLDNLTNTVHNVSQTPNYSFYVATGGNIANRFSLVFNANPLNTASFEFTAKNVDDYAHLEWSVTEAGDRVSYDVQSSEDGSNFKQIGTKAAIDETNGASYKYRDAEQLVSKRYYRIKASYSDGKSAYSRTKVLSAGVRGGFSFTLAPNPVRDNLYVTFMGEEKATSVKIYDATGKLLQEQTTDGSDLTINTSTLAGGSYLIEVTTTTGSKQVQKFIK